MFHVPEPLLGRLVLVLAHFLWQGLVIAVLPALLLMGFRVRSPAIRYAICLTAFAAMALCPLVTWYQLQSPDPVPVTLVLPFVDSVAAPMRSGQSAGLSAVTRPPSSSDTAAEPMTPMVVIQPIPSNVAFTHQPQPAGTWRKTFHDARPQLVAVWLAGVVLLSFRLLLGAVGIQRWKRYGTAVDPEWQATVVRLCERLQMTVPLVRVSWKVQEAVAVGLLKPMILLPASWMTKLPPDMLEAVLAHELAHLRRLDLYVNLFQRLVETLLYYHPAVWWLSRRLRMERELCCDALAVATTDNPLRYAETLEHVARMVTQSRHSRLAIAFRPSEAGLIRRIRFILEPDAATSGLSWIPGLLTLVVIPAMGLAAWISIDPDAIAGAPPATESAAPVTANEADADAGRSRSADPAAAVVVGLVGASNEWPQWAGSPLRNNVSATTVPTTWDVKSSQRIRWSAQLGTSTYSSPVVAGGKVIIGTNNGHALDPRYPADKDLACLACFEQATGEFQWQYVSEKMPPGHSFDWPGIGLCSTACISGDRVWVVTNRCEVLCLDIHGFHDEENDGPFQNEPLQTKLDADVIWKTDMFSELGVRPLHQSVSSIAHVDGVLLLNTSNGPDDRDVRPAAPDAPTFLALDAATGRVLWTHNAARDSILLSGASCSMSGASPAVATIDGVRQAIFCGGEGWVYSYDFNSLKAGRTEVLWRFDCNPKTARFQAGEHSHRNTLLASPVVWNSRVYVATGRDPELLGGEGDGDLWCIDATRRGDLSSELVYNNSFENGEKPIAHKSVCACDIESGDFTRPNPNSGAIWHYSSQDSNGDGRISYEESFHGTLSAPVIHNGLLFAADLTGILHCVDATASIDGEPRVYWTADRLAACRATPLVAGNKLYVCDEDGDVAVFAVSKKRTLLAEQNLGSAIYSTPCAVNQTLFMATRSQLLAIGESPPQSDDAQAATSLPMDAVATNGVIKQVTGADSRPAERPSEWGSVTNGLRARVVPVSASMSEDAIDISQSVTSFDTPDDVAFAIELHNASGETITLAEPRYGESYGDSKGKAASDWLGQFLFAIDYYDDAGNPIGRPVVEHVSPMNPVSGTLAARLDPNQTLRVLLRPSRWQSVLSQRPGLGKQRAVIRYLGISDIIKQSLRLFETRKTLLDAVGGEVVSPAVDFEVKTLGYRPTGISSSNLFEDDITKKADGSDIDPVSLLTWGEPENGLRSAVELIPEGGRRWRWLSHGTKATVRLHVQNVGSQAVQLASLMWLSELQIRVDDSAGNAVTVDSTWYSGVTPVVRVHLQPQQVVTFDAGNIGLAASKERAGGFEHITNRTMVIPRGEYSLQGTERFGQSFRMTDGQGNVLVPLDSDWQGRLVSGVTKVSVSNEVIGCRIVNAVTGELVSGTTTNWRFIKPKSADADETTVAHMIWGPNSPGEIYFTIPEVPEDIAARSDRDELEIEWGVGGNSDYEPFTPDKRIPLRQFFHEGPEAARLVLETIRLVPKLAEDDGSRQ